MAESDETKRLSSEASAEGGHTIEDVFRLVVSINDRLIRLEDRFETHRTEFEAHRAEFVEFRDKVDSRLLKMTTPLSETLEALRGEVRQVAERQDAFAVELADLKRIVRKIDHKLGGLSSDMYDIKADLRDHEGRLEALEPQ